ncbi:hypothetical protein FQN60_003768 [Etheostoma spectabile]|uniref:Uncharacterized protein n=1 Tax=Etheostoma spectabile TaxID=54343 RepID=A0A5J5CV65_9PERO|nr:hypothetical protein FQN60_003768 [Etheostoma spectabile]
MVIQVMMLTVKWWRRGSWPRDRETKNALPHAAPFLDSRMWIAVLCDEYNKRGRP